MCSHIECCALLYASANKVLHAAVSGLCLVHRRLRKLVDKLVLVIPGFVLVTRQLKLCCHCFNQFVADPHLIIVIVCSSVAVWCFGKRSEPISCLVIGVVV